MIGYIVAWKKFYFGPLLTPLILISLTYGYLFEKRFCVSFHCTSLEAACRNGGETPDMVSIYEAYIPPCFRSRKLEEVKQVVHAQSR